MKRSEPKQRGAEPCFETLKQAEAVTGAPIAWLKSEKKAGNPGFQHGRLYFWTFLKTALPRMQAESGIDWANEAKKWTAKLKQQEHDSNAEKLWDAGDVRRSVIGFVTAALNVLRQRVENEAPAQMAGLDVASARVIGKRIVDDVYGNLRALTETDWKP